MKSDSRDRLTEYLHTIRIRFDLTPAHRLVRPGSGITTIEFLRRVNVHCAVCAVPHQASVRDVVLDKAPSENDHPGFLRMYGDVIEFSNISSYADIQDLRRRLECVEIEHIAKATVRQRWTEDWNIILICPITYGCFIVDFFTQAVNDFTGRPN